MTQHKNQTLAIRQFAHRFLQPAAPFVLKHLILGTWPARGQVFGRVALDALRIHGRPGDPPFPAASGLQPVQAPVNQNSREPDLKRQFLAERSHVGIRLHEGVLYRFVRVRRITQVMKRNARGPALMPIDQSRVRLTRLVQLTGSLKGLYADGNGGVRFPTGF